MIVDFDKNGYPLYYNGSQWMDIHGNNVSSTKISHFEQRGDTGTVAIDSTGVKTVAVTFPTAYANVLDKVTVTLKDPTQTDEVFGGIWTSNASLTGFTVNVKVTTASATAASTAKVHWEALGQ